MDVILRPWEKGVVTVKVPRPRRVGPKLDWDGVYTDDSTFQLPKESRDELAEIAGLEVNTRDARAMLERVRFELSRFPSMVAAVDNAPRPAHKLVQLENALRTPRRLAMMLLAWNSQGLLWDFTLAGLYFETARAIARKIIEDEASPEEVKELLGVAERVRAKLHSTESRQGKPKGARRAVVWKLSCIFDYYDSNDHMFPLEIERTMERGRRPLSQKQLRAEFVRVALTAGKIRHPTLPVVARASASRLVRMLPPVCEESRDAGEIHRLLRSLAETTDEPVKQELRQMLRSLAARQRRKHQAWARILRAATRLRAADGSMTKEQSVDRVCSGQPELYAAYREACNATIRRPGVSGSA